MRKTISVIVTLLFFSATSLIANSEGGELSAPAPLNMSGQVIDKVSGEGLAGATLTIEGFEEKIFTDFDGRFTLNGLMPGKYDIKVSYISYEDVTLKQFALFGNEKLEVKLAANGEK